jgi:predicted metalloprotease with PDZ domain
VLLASHVFKQCVRVLNLNIRMFTCTVKAPLKGCSLQSLQPKCLPGAQSEGSVKRARNFETAWPAVAAALGLFLVFASQADAQAQTLQARISTISLNPAQVRIDLEFPGETNVVSFRNSYADVIALGQRIQTIEAANARGDTIALRKLAPGEFQAAERFWRLSYLVNFTEPVRAPQMARVSWLTPQQGLLMLADLLPQWTREAGRASSVSIALQVPVGWSIASNLDDSGNQQYVTNNPDQAVFLIGPSVRQKSRRLGLTDFSLVTSGKWPFSEGDALKISRKLIEEYSEVTGHELKRRSTLMLIPFPGNGTPDNWSAEARGNCVVLLLGNSGDSRIVRQRLALVLSHELFHLWVPNSLALDGAYDWFFEGFTLYQALRTDLRLRLISFKDYLDTIARVYESYLASGDYGQLSLLEASERRWTSASSMVYQKGMLVAFLYDVLVRSLSDCKTSSEDVYRQLFSLNSTGQENGNKTIIGLLSAPEGMAPFVKDYIDGARAINLEGELSSLGFQMRRTQTGFKLSTGERLNKTQKKLAKCLAARN